MVWLLGRMCLAAKLPLVESGTAGYLGQVTVIRQVSGIVLVVQQIHLYF